MLKHSYTREQWLELPSTQRAMCIAFSRLEHLIEGHRQEALNIWAKRQRLRQGQKN